MGESKNMKLLFIDTETGGVTTDESLLSLGCVVWADGQIIDKLEVLIVPPVFKITAGALKVNKIVLLDHIEKGISPEEAKKKFLTFLYKRWGNKYPIVLGGHNTKFDADFLRTLIGDKKFNRCFSHRMVDTCPILLYLMQIGVYSETSASLENACKFFKINLDRETGHSALRDAIATAELYTLLIEIGKRAFSSYQQHIEIIQESK